LTTLQREPGLCVELVFTGGVPHVWNLQPQTLRDYGIRSLADRIKDLEQLLYICKLDDTTQTKDEVFSQYYSKTISGSRTSCLLVSLSIISVDSHTKEWLETFQAAD